MGASPLRTFPSGTPVFLDANVLINGLSGRSAECRNLLDRCAREDCFGVTTFEVISEVTHKLMLFEACAKKIISKESASLLRKRLKDITRLTQYWHQTERIFRMHIVVLPTDGNRLRSGYKVRASHGMLTNDSLIVAAMQESGLTSVASADDDFDHVAGLTRYEPSDLP